MVANLISGSQDDSEDIIVLENGVWYYRFEYEKLIASPQFTPLAKVDRVIQYESRAYDAFLVKAGEMSPEE